MDFVGIMAEKCIELGISKIIELRNKYKLQNIDEKHFENKVNRIKEYFVETTSFERAIKESSENKIIVVTGKMGMGKTETAYMIASRLRKDYCIKIIDFNNINIISDIKKKEIFIFEDFLGRQKEDISENYLNKFEKLLKEIRYIKNKIIILDVRKSLLEEVRRIKPNISSILDTEGYICDLEKWFDTNARFKLLEKYIENSKLNGILENEEFVYKVINHENFTPLLIYRGVSQCKQKEYEESFIHTLEHPEFMWDEEFKSLDSFSKWYLKILYSFPSYNIKKEILNECFLYFLDKEGIKYTENIDNTMLQVKSLIRYEDNNKITFRHKSIIEYIEIKIGELDKTKITNNSLYFEQINSRLVKPERMFELMKKNDLSKTIPISFFDESSEVENNKFNVYLSNIHNDIFNKNENISKDHLIFAIENFFENHTLSSIIYYGIIIDILSLDYDFSKILNNREYMKKLYKYSDWFNIWKLIVVTEKDKRNDSGRFDFREFSDEILDFIDCNLNTHIQIEYEEKIKEKFIEKLKKDEINQNLDLYDTINAVKCVFDDLEKEIIKASDSDQYDIINDNINNIDYFFDNLGKEINLDEDLEEYLEEIEEEEYTKELIIDGIFDHLENEIEEICKTYEIDNFNISDKKHDYSIKVEISSVNKWFRDYYKNKFKLIQQNIIKF